MADNTIDSLSIQIASNADNAVKSIDRLAASMLKLSGSMGGIDSGKFLNIASGVSQLAQAMGRFTGGVKTADFTRIATGLNKLGTVNIQGVSDASRAISTLTANLSQIGTIAFDSAGIANIANAIANLGRKTVTQATANIPALTQSLAGLVNGLNGLGTINFDIAGLAALTQSITRLGGKASTNAAPNIQSLGVALRQLMTTLSTAPRVSQNLINMTNALANLARNGSRVSSASRAMQNSLNGYSASTLKAGKHTRNFASQIGMLYARFFLLMRIGRWFGKAIISAMDYIETLNYCSIYWIYYIF